MNIDFSKLGTLSSVKTLDLFSAGDSILMVLEDYLSEVKAPQDYAVEFNGGSGVVALKKGGVEVDNYHWCQVDYVSFKHRAVTFTSGDTIYFQ